MTAVACYQWMAVVRRTADREFRVPLQAAQLSPPVERFTIVIEPTGENAGAIRLRWDTTQLSASFTASSRP